MKIVRENLLYAAASGTQKLSSIGCTTTSASHNSSNIDDTSPLDNLGQEILPRSLTDEGINVSGQPRNEASSDHFDVSSRLQTPGLNSDREQQNQIFPVYQMHEMPATSSSQMHDFEVSSTSSNITELDDLLPSTHVQENKISPANCDSTCCPHVVHKVFPAIPPHELKKTSIKQLRTDGQFRHCPFSVFSKFSWVTYCLTRGTIACFHCKKAMERNLITFSYHTEKAFSSGEFCNWKKCHEKLEKTQNSHCHKEAVEKLAHIVHEKNDIGAQLDF